MDNQPVTWSPKPGLLATGWLVAVLAAAGAAATGLAGDRSGMVLFGAGAALFALLAAHGTVLRPKLAVDATGLRVRTLSGTHRLDWPATRIRLVNTRRLGRDTVTLEIESGDLLLVLGWLELGADPRDVLEVLAAYRT